MPRVWVQQKLFEGSTRLTLRAVDALQSELPNGAAWTIRIPNPTFVAT
jgi:hypothetical protein